MATMRIAVLGGGLMGHGIAQVFAAAGHPVRVFEPNAAVRGTVRERIRANLRDLGEDEAAAEAVEPVETLAAAVEGAGYVVEAALEQLDLKQRLFAEAEAHAAPDAIFASNTSVIPITAIMRSLQRRERALGTHWWNPPFLVPLVEVIGTEWSDPDVIARVIALHRAIGKTPVHVKKDVPGFIGNRLQHALWREAISLVENGICDAETVDVVVKASFGRRLAVLGPIENADLVGTDLTLAIHQTVLPAIDSRPAPSPLLETLVAEGRLGMKSGEGFRRWTEAEMSELRRKVAHHLKGARAADA
jgi:3-hydroxybutyryl-CoA dehydrogenase